MIARQLKPEVLSLSAIDWDRRIFDQLVPLPEGTTYNSYLVKGSEKTALIDTVYAPFTAEYLETLKEAGLRKLDYIIANHGEQDHSGSIPAVLAQYPEAKVVTNARCKGLIADALPVAADKFIEVKDGETLSLGNKTLQFFITPWVHWPDTMVTYLAEDRILFPCDFLGSHLASSDLFALDEARVEVAARRYYAEIMMPYRAFIQKHLLKLAPLKIDFIAPGHGPVYSRPELILDLYRRWASDQPLKQVVIPYVSMYGNTLQMVDYLVDRLTEAGLEVTPFNLIGGDTGKLASLLVEASTVVFASSAVLAGPHPDVVHAAYLANALRPKAKFASVIGSYGWGGSIVAKKIVESLSGLKNQLQFFDPVLVQGRPGADAFKALDVLAQEIVAANQAMEQTAVAE